MQTSLVIMIGLLTNQCTDTLTGSRQQGVKDTIINFCIKINVMIDSNICSADYFGHDYFSKFCN